jgi:hypothetical protein
MRARRLLVCGVVLLGGLGAGASWLAVPASGITPGVCATCQEGRERSARESVEIQERKEAAEREARERAAREAQEREAAEAKAHEAREANEREARVQREEVERESSASSHPGRCVVPRLRGESLSAARKALRNAHCTLGKVTRPARRDGQLVVATQSVRAGRNLAWGAPVAVKLGPATRR